MRKVIRSTKLVTGPDNDEVKPVVTGATFNGPSELGRESDMKIKDCYPNRTIREATKTRDVLFWGAEYKVTPALVTEVLGDGKLLMAFTPLATRPNWYVIAVDSTWFNKKGQLNYEIDEIPEDRIYEAIEGEFGCVTDDDYLEDTVEDFPVLHDSCGASWCCIGYLQGKRFRRTVDW